MPVVKPAMHLATEHLRTPYTDKPFNVHYNTIDFSAKRITISKPKITTISVHSWYLFNKHNIVICGTYFVKDITHRCTYDSRSTDWLIEHGLTSPPTQYRLYGRQFYRSEDPTNSIKGLKEHIEYTINIKKQ